MYSTTRPCFAIDNDGGDGNGTSASRGADCISRNVSRASEMLDTLSTHAKCIFIRIILTMLLMCVYIYSKLLNDKKSHYCFTGI